MKTFLELVASSLLQRFGSDLSSVVVVFPGKRASLFLNQALAEQSSTPVWAPRYQTISELFQQASPLAQADPIESVCRLYASYSRHIEDPQPLDRFWTWGEILLSDFDDVDKHLVDAHQLFRNIADLHELDDNSYITPEQEEALRSFFRNFSLEENSQLKQQFLRLWNRMSDIYSDLLESMRKDGVLYEGALQRYVVEELRQARLSGSEPTSLRLFATDQQRQLIYAFVGFNVLNDVEQALFDELQARHQALFFWDYDTFYFENNHEAGHFLRQNLQRYGNELSADNFNNLRQPKRLELVCATSENAQARFIPQWLDEHLTSRENRTAVVLCNEQLLQPVLHSIPSEGTPKAVNITMGFPLADTPVFSFVTSLVNLQTEGYDPARGRFREAFLRTVQRHPFAHFVEESVWNHPAGSGSELLTYLLNCLSAIIPHLSDDAEADIPQIYRQLYVEALFRTFTALSRLRDLMNAPSASLSVSDFTLRRLLRTLLQAQSVPFHGEPAVGMQVMGVLETRALDFDHLLLLSVGEGFLPKAVADTSLIPYNLRQAFGLTTIRHKVAVYAYYFYRLIQRASHVTFVYNESNSGVRQNEPSRFLRQLLAETDFPIRALRLQASTKVATCQPIRMEKSPEVMDLLHKTFDINSQKPGEKARILSPTAINTYTTCPLRFYYRYVQKLEVPRDPDDGLDAGLFGEVFHKSAELVYRQLTSAGPVVRAEDIDRFTQQKGQALEPIIRQAFREVYFKDKEEDYSGILVIAVRVIQSYLLQLLRHDRKLTPFNIIGLEQWCEMVLEAGDVKVRTGGIIDRLDEVPDKDMDGAQVLRVVDYKTGGTPSAVTELPRLFVNTSQKEHYYFQTILYAIIQASQKQRLVTPCLFFVHKAGSEDYSSKLRLARKQLNDVRPLQEDFLYHLTDVIAEIFDSQKPFTQTTQTDPCQYCDFAHFCGR